MAAMLRPGFTTVRDAGGAGWGLARRQRRHGEGAALFISPRQTAAARPASCSDHLRPMSFVPLLRAGDTPMASTTRKRRALGTQA